MTHNFDDTHPVVTVFEQEPAQPPGRAGLGLLFGAGLLTLAAVLLLALPGTTPPTPNIQPDAVVQLPTQVTDLSATPPHADPTPQVLVLDAERVTLLLQTPVAMLARPDDGSLLKYDPYTFIPKRPRTEFVEYTAAAGDTIDGIARRFNLNADTLAWCNDRRVVFRLRPGDVLRIPPVDGACYVTLGTLEETIADVAERFNVSPQELLNSPFANFADMSPDTVLSGGMNLFIPGGEGPLITWNPPSEVEVDEQGNIRRVSFAKGLAGSCGPVEPGGGAVAWGNPLPNGTWVRGFFVGHTGIDLAAPPGTPIFAANSGPVLFSGFSTWGYGETVVLSHGPFSTLYAHMSARHATCGSFLYVGQVVGLVGSTGNSTGPHLHFEIRYNDQPFNPSGTPGIGW